MKLYNYFRSSASFRVRIALNLKGLPYEYLPLHIRKPEDRKRLQALNPQTLVPVLQDGDHHLTQSLAIMEYLEETHPNPPLLPKKHSCRARVRALALIVACEIHPLNNSRVLGYLTSTLGVSEEVKSRWYQHWARAHRRVRDSPAEQFAGAWLLERHARCFRGSEEQMVPTLGCARLTGVRGASRRRLAHR